MRSYALHSAFVRWGTPIILLGGVLGTVAFRLGVERNVRATFRCVGQRDYETLLEQNAPHQRRPAPLVREALPALSGAALRGQRSGGAGSTVGCHDNGAMGELGKGV